MLRFYRKIAFGKYSSDSGLEVNEINIREYFLFLPLTFLVILFGVFPNILLKFFDISNNFIVFLFSV